MTRERRNINESEATSRLRKIAAGCCIAVLSATLSCSKVPSYVIQPDDMASLMADVHTAEAVIDLNRSDYMNDSSKQALKQAVYARHGVTQAQVDTSFEWYGHNMTYYMEVYDKTIEILDHRLIETGNRIAAENALSIAGDSVDVWPNPRFVAISDRMPSKNITFSFPRDHNWEKGDSYTWRAKFFHNINAVHWGIVVEYSNGTAEYVSLNFSEDGWKELTLYTDSLLTPVKIYGYLNAETPAASTLWVDSIAMVRNRLNPQNYSMRYRQRNVRNFRRSVEVRDDTTEVKDGANAPLSRP